jgi:RNA polymerase sigma factor (sigma-70 family)
MHLTDKNLVDKVLKGDSQAFGIIIKNTEGLVSQIVFKMIPNTEDRKDLVQNIYLKAFHKLSSFRFQSKLSTWIAQIAYNNCLSHLEKKKLVLPGGGQDKNGSGEDTLALLSSRYGMDSYSGTEQFIDQKELSGILQVEINSLPPVYKTLISLYHQEELSYEEMVEITGLPEGTVKSYLFRARKMLKENLLAKYKKEAL